MVIRGRRLCRLASAGEERHFGSRLTKPHLKQFRQLLTELTGTWVHQMPDGSFWTNPGPLGKHGQTRVYHLCVVCRKLRHLRTINSSGRLDTARHMQDDATVLVVLTLVQPNVTDRRFSFSELLAMLR